MSAAHVPTGWLRLKIPEGVEVLVRASTIGKIAPRLPAGSIGSTITTSLGQHFDVETPPDLLVRMIFVEENDANG